MTSPETNNDMFNALTANMTPGDDVVTKVTVEVQDAQRELIEAMAAY